MKDVRQKQAGRNLEISFTNRLLLHIDRALDYDSYDGYHNTLKFLISLGIFWHFCNRGTFNTLLNNKWNKGNFISI